MNRKKLVILGFIGALMITLSPAKVTAQEVIMYQTEESTVVSPKSTQYVWYIKVENGKKYRRLWDGTNAKWVTDWILCP